MKRSSIKGKMSSRRRNNREREGKETEEIKGEDELREKLKSKQI
jgi:hypothetical protein